MHIRLIPAYPHPNIVFTLALPDPVHDEKKPCPPAWLMQSDNVQRLQRDGFDVDLPRDVHAYDKAAWHTALMTEVIFDLTERTIVCNFVDESSVTWPMSSTGGDIGCMLALEGVVSDVHGASELEKQRSRNAELRQLQTSSYQGVSGSPPVSPISATPPKAHKRQKSLFSSIVAAVKGALSDSSNRTTLPLSLPPLKIPSSSHSRSPSTFSRTQRSPPPSPTVLEHPAHPAYHLQVRPRVPIPLPPHSKPKSPPERLRHRARSSLVDIFRRHVLPALSTVACPSFVESQSAPDWRARLFGYPAGQYPCWVARSLLRRTEERLREMMAEASAHGLGSLVPGPSQTPAALRDAEDEDDATSASTSASAGSLSTDTDGSSLHTPTDSPVCSPLVPGIVSPSGMPHPTYLETEAQVHQQVPRSPSPPSPVFDFHKFDDGYRALARAQSSLLSYLSALDSAPHQMPSVHRYGPDLTILEIKSRRRAWSARDYVGGARMSLIGLATPFCSSPLARCEPVTADALARVQAQAVRDPELPNMGSSRSFVGLPDLHADFGIRTVTKEMDVRLFPVCEEEEDIEYGLGNQSGYSSDDDSWQDFDLESGLFVFPHPGAESTVAPGSADSSRVYAHMHPMVRTRTQSTRNEHPRLPPPRVVQPSPRVHAEGALSSSSLLCQPLNVKIPASATLLAEQPPFDIDEDHAGEFTLAMDLPSPPRGWLGDDVDAVPCR